MQPPPGQLHSPRRRPLSGAPPTSAAHRRDLGSQPPGGLRWQSWMVLLLTLPAAAVWATILLLRLLLPPAPSALAAAIGLAAGGFLATLVWLARAATPAGACTGGLLMACFCLTTPGWRSCAWPVLLMLSLTLGATRAGRARKQRLVSAVSLHELKHGRGAAQVAANLGVAALAGALIDAHGQVVALTVLLAALAEATADTLSSEIGQAFAGAPRSILTLRLVAPGTDGGVTFTGTLVGVAGATLVAAAGSLVLQLPGSAMLVAAAAGIAGLLFDSLLGATLEGAGLLNNDAVNFLSTLFSAGAALVAAATGGLG